MILDPITPSKSLAFELSRAGYDVWLSNNRGSIYGKGHQNLSSESGDPQFWKFSFDEIARYDVPAVIDYVLNQTKQGNNKVQNQNLMIFVFNQKNIILFTTVWCNAISIASANKRVHCLDFFQFLVFYANI